MTGPALNVSVPVLPVGVRRKLSVWPPSFGPAFMPVAKPATLWAPASSLDAAGFEIALNVGALLMPFTVMVKVCAADVLTFGATLLPLSESVTETVALPKALTAGV